MESSITEVLKKSGRCTGALWRESLEKIYDRLTGRRFAIERSHAGICQEAPQEKAPPSQDARNADPIKPAETPFALAKGVPSLLRTWDRYRCGRKA